MNRFRLARALAGIALSTALLGAQAPTASPPPPSDTVAARSEVLALINKMFDGMHTRDTAAIRSTMHPAAALISATRRQDGTPAIQVDSIDSWLRAIATPRPETLDERIFNEKVFVDGTLAAVWVDYSLYIGTRLNHCGIDAFQVAKGADGWKIIALADTRRRTGCIDVPARR